MNTYQLIEKSLKTLKEVDVLLTGSLRLGENYIKAAMLLLEEKHITPSKALLRILTELSTKLLWCLYIPHGTNTSEEEYLIQEKINRWKKDSLQRIAFGVEAFGSSDLFPEIPHQVQNLRKLANSVSDKSMPRIKDIFKELPKEWYEEVYPRAYWQFNDSIHPDLNLIGSIIHAEEKSVVVSWDSFKDMKDLNKYCIVCAYHLNYLVRIHYRWPIDLMKEGYEELMDIIETS